MRTVYISLLKSQPGFQGKSVFRNQFLEVSKDGALYALNYGGCGTDAHSSLAVVSDGTRSLFLCLKTQQVMDDRTRKGQTARGVGAPACCPDLFHRGRYLWSDVPEQVQEE